MIRELKAVAIRLREEYRRYRDFRAFIEESTWDEILCDATGALDKFMLIVIGFAVGFFIYGLFFR